MKRYIRLIEEAAAKKKRAEQVGPAPQPQQKLEEDEPEQKVQPKPRPQRRLWAGMEPPSPLMKNGDDT